MHKDLRPLIESGKKVARLSSILNLLQWDLETYMPSAGSEERGAAIALISSLLHKEKTSKSFRLKLEKWIDLESGYLKVEGLSFLEKKALQLWRRDFLQQVKLPKSFVTTWATTTAEALPLWIRAKEENDFALFAPTLDKIISLARKKADLLGYKDTPYDALLDLFEPDCKSSFLTPLFASLKQGLQHLLEPILQKNKIQDSFLYSNYPRDKQILFGSQILDQLKLDRTRARLDESAHPFSTGLHPKDVRFTTHIEPHMPMSSILSILHEVGHSFYELGLPEHCFGTPMMEASSLGIHESQSRWWETRIGKSLPFWRYFFPLMQGLFPKELSGVSLDTFYKAINAVTPSPIRIQSDEVTYNFHIILRFEIEKALIEGRAFVKEIPDLWREKMQTLLLLTPRNDQEGCLQDVHWSSGLIGYFPTYTLGNLYASHFFDAFEKRFPLWEKQVELGAFEQIIAWLRDEIHQHGRLYSGEELAKRVTGHPLSSDAYLKYLTTKFNTIYSLNRE